MRKSTLILHALAITVACAAPLDAAQRLVLGEYFTQGG